MKIFLISLGTLLSISAKKCGNKNEMKIPVCIQQKIDSIKKEERWNPPAEVYEYSYNGKSVFYFSSNCCDFFNSVVDENCNYVCAPSGGITGKGDRKCDDFHANAKQIRLVWKDERASP